MNNSSLELSILDNNYESVINLLDTDVETKYKFENGKCHKLCNGNSQHLNECTENICYKTATYHAIEMNCRAYNTIYSLASNLYKHDLSLRRLCKCCHTDDDQQSKYSMAVISLIEGFVAAGCICRQKKTYLQYYAEDFLNLKVIYNVITENIDAIKEYCQKKVDDNDSVKLELEPLESCVHEDISFYKITFCKKEEHNDTNIVILNDTAKKLLSAFEFYERNMRIFKLILNEQTLEGMMFFLESVDDEETMISVFHKLIRDLDPFIDINYKNKYYDNDFMSILLSTRDFPKIASKILAKGYSGSLLPLLKYPLDRKYWNSLRYLIENIDKNEIVVKPEDNVILRQIVRSDNAVTDKMGYIEKLLQVGFIINNDIIKFVINSKNNEELVKSIFDLLETKSIIIDRISAINLIYAVQYSSVKIFKKLLNYNNDVDDF